jgi:outer membrane PBP1 activator LpoA protein
MKMRTAYYSLLAFGVLLLAACSSVPVTTPDDTAASEAEARAAAARGDYVAARTLYEDLVAQSAGMQRAAYQIELARAELELGMPELALGLLDATPAELPDALESERSAVRASAYFALGRAVDAVRLLVEREIWLDSSDEILANQNLIWEGMIDGWLALTPLTRLGAEDPQFRDALFGWRESFPNHPAAGGILAERFAISRGAGSRPARIAVLLPLTQRPAESLAIQAGVFAGRLEDENLGNSSIHFYDTSQRGAVESFLTAQLEGADFIIGPLLPGEVGDVRAQAGFVPTLALNLPLSSSASPAPNFFQFALSSDDEIEAIAARAIRDGHRTAVALHASSARGRRLADRFREAFESRGGRVINSVEYVAANAASSIRFLLNITQSENRHQRLQANLGRTIEFEPRRRADIDMIFLQADPGVGAGDASLVAELLASNGASPEDIPTYATSDIHDPTRTAADRDLDGLIFPDVPLLVDPDGSGRAAATRFREFTTASARQQPRLFAFGFDAYLLIQALYAGSNTGWPLPGATGELYLGEDGRIRRVLPFAEFRSGRPATLAPNLGVFGAR